MEINYYFKKVFLLAEANIFLLTAERAARGEPGKATEGASDRGNSLLESEAIPVDLFQVRESPRERPEHPLKQFGQTNHETI